MEEEYISISHWGMFPSIMSFRDWMWPALTCANSDLAVEATRIKRIELIIERLESIHQAHTVLRLALTQIVELGYGELYEDPWGDRTEMVGISQQALEAAAILTQHLNGN